MRSADAVIVGSGVIGLTTAICLAEGGLSTTIITAAPARESTSVAAGAIWGPVRCGPPDRAYAWARSGLAVLSELAAEPAAAVCQVSGVEVAASPASPPGWSDLLPDLRMLGPAELPAGFACGWHYTAPVVTMPLYLDYLRSRYEALGGVTEVAPVRSLSSVGAPVVVNCAGIGARGLVPDPEVFPVRGQIVVTENPGIDEFYINHALHGDDYVYIFPHGDQVVLGGTAAEDDWDLRPREDITERILRDCAAVRPGLRGARVLAERVGLRPCRPEVRLEAEPLPGGRTLWHNYGHGGAGVTLSWGCARELTESVLTGAGGRPASRTRAGAPGRNHGR